MDCIWDYRPGVALADRSLVGFDVDATDGRVGDIIASSIVVGQAHMLVDAGSWISGKKRMIPAGVIERVDVEREAVHVSMSKEQIKAAPDFDAERRDDRDEYVAYYEPFWRKSPIATSKADE